MELRAIEHMPPGPEKIKAQQEYQRRLAAAEAKRRSGLLSTKGGASEYVRDLHVPMQREINKDDTEVRKARAMEMRSEHGAQWTVPSRGSLGGSTTIPRRRYATHSPAQKPNPGALQQQQPQHKGLKAKQEELTHEEENAIARQKNEQRAAELEKRMKNLDLAKENLGTRVAQRGKENRPKLVSRR